METVTQAEVGKRVGLSQRAVAYALSDDPQSHKQLRPETRSRIRKTAQAMGYRPDRAACSLRLKKSNLIGLIVREFCNPQFARINQALIAELERRKFEVLVTDVTDLADSTEMEDLYAHRPGGMILGPLHDSALCPFLRTLVGEGYPLVCFFTDLTPACDAVAVDIYSAARDAMNHFFEQGQRRIGCYVSNNGHPILAAYQEAMAEAGLAARPEWTQVQWGGIEEGMKFGRSIAVGADQPTAYLFHDDDAAMGFMRALLDRGLRVPQDVAVIGCGDYPYSAVNAVRLSSIRFPTEAFVKPIVEFLSARLEKRAGAGWQKTTVPGEFVARESSVHQSGAAQTALMERNRQ